MGGKKSVCVIVLAVTLGFLIAFGGCGTSPRLKEESDPERERLHGVQPDFQMSPREQKGRYSRPPKEVEAPVKVPATSPDKLAMLKKENERLMAQLEDLNRKAADARREANVAAGQAKTLEAEKAGLGNRVAQLERELKAAVDQGKLSAAEVDRRQREIEAIRKQIADLERTKELEKRYPTEYTVKRGDCLWAISEQEMIYGDPFKWPTIYAANKDRIRDPDLIYPLQVLKIPR